MRDNRRGGSAFAKPPLLKLRQAKGCGATGQEAGAGELATLPARRALQLGEASPSGGGQGGGRKECDRWEV